MWSLEPSFFDEQGALVSEDLPELDPEDAATWLSTAAAFSTLSITASVNGVALQSVTAAQRYGRMHKLEIKHPAWMLLKVLLAEVHYLLFDKAGAQQRLLDVQHALGCGKDGKLDTAVRELSKLIKEEEEEGGGDDEEVEVEQGIQVTRYVRPPPLPSFPCLWSVEEIRHKWQTRTQAALAEFGRYAAVSSNLLEGIFSLDGQSLWRLVKRGFSVNSIEGISATSRIKNKVKIVQILENTQSCSKYLTSAAAALDEPTIQDVHRRLMEGNNLTHEVDDDGQVYAALVPCGSYRRVACYTTNGNLETRYCPWRLIPREMQWYFEEAQRAMADGSADPFLVSAWLHLAFLSIHPFADGNGRMGRMISSIPLVGAGLPPVVVAFERKDKYFAALIEARESSDLVGLASFLKEEVELAIILQSGGCPIVSPASFQSSYWQHQLCINSGNIL